MGEKTKEITRALRFDFENFYLFTAADFTPCDLPLRPPDFYSFSGSTYWDLGDRVVRWSDHWGEVASCRWLYEGWRLRAPRCLAGECRYADFRSRVAGFGETAVVRM